MGLQIVARRADNILHSRVSGTKPGSSQIEYHVPVLLKESLDLLAVRPDGVYLDATLGGGGHARAILEMLGPDGRLTGLDQDADALDAACGWMAPYGDRFRAVRGNFGNLLDVFGPSSQPVLDGVLFDLGVSSRQLDVPERGFSFRAGGPLDMRMDTRAGMTAADIIGTWTEREIEAALREFGEERFAGRISRSIVRERDRIATTADLADVVKRAVPGQGAGNRIHPATKTFQALRIVINDEMQALREGLNQAIALLRPGGRIVVISYHSLEDRMVKTTFRDGAAVCVCPARLPFCCCGHKASLALVTRKSVVASSQEVAANPRARSARARAAERLV